MATEVKLPLSVSFSFEIVGLNSGNNTKIAIIQNKFTNQIFSFFNRQTKSRFDFADLLIIYMDQSNAIIRNAATREIFILVNENDLGAFDLTDSDAGVIDDRVVDLDTYTEYQA